MTDFHHSGFHPEDRRQGDRRAPGCTSQCADLVRVEVERVVGESRLDQREYFTQLLEKHTQHISMMIASSVPDGDFVGHRKAHESYIQAAAARRDFWQSLLKEITKVGLLGFLAWASIHLWQAFVNGPKG